MALKACDKQASQLLDNPVPSSAPNSFLINSNVSSSWLLYFPEKHHDSRGLFLKCHPHGRVVLHKFKKTTETKLAFQTIKFYQISLIYTNKSEPKKDRRGCLLMHSQQSFPGFQHFNLTL